MSYQFQCAVCGHWYETYALAMECCDKVIVVACPESESEEAACEATIDDLRRDADQLLDLYYNCQAENEQLRARIAELEATPDYLAKENDE